MSELELVNDNYEESNTDSEVSQELQATVIMAIEDAVDFIDNTMSPKRAEAMRYYNGEALGNEQEGRSTAQSLDVRDTVQQMLPSLIRIFCGSEQPVEYAPRGAEDVETAKQATDYVNYLLTNNQDESFIQILYGTFLDALVKGSGFLKYVYRTTERIETSEYEALDDSALAALNADPQNVTTRLDTVNVDNQPQMHSVTIERTIVEGKIVVASVAPEEILINRDARTFEDADIVAHRKYATVSELVEMGYDYSEMLSYSTNEDSLSLDNEEARQRLLSSSTDSDYDDDDDSRKKVLYIEAYMKLDISGDGISELRKICCAGSGYEILRNDPATEIPFAHFCPSPEPHQFFGLSVADITMDIQRIKSSVLRASLDSLAMSTHPRVGVVEGQANLADVMSVEAGGIIRMRNPGAVQPFLLPYVGRDAFPMLEYLDKVREDRTGMSRAAAGLNPEQLQSSTLAAVTQTINAAQQRIEMIARLFADNGMARLYKGLLKLAHENVDETQMIRLRNQFVPVQPDQFSVDMDVVTNVSLGAGSSQERLMLLGQIAGIQKDLLEKLGPENPIVSAQNYYNTLVSTLELGGIKDVNRYFNDPAQYQPPEPTGPPEKDINERLIETQMYEIESNIQKKLADIELERERMFLENDRRRDESEANIVLKAAEISARFGAQVDVAEIKSNSDRDRELVKNLVNQQQQGPQDGQF